ncbi:TonB-dependent siderophore receptor [Acinetobacter larvae]|uniref:Ligand-gated channel n=1 Tax=Acinetobacter larvae TaxID=1789224 RepID=A0A1B2M047_9GAMM|nr:TonB-dependent receptor [Acinetobacter larvae]AOA58413.1 ligand-gated channel [Acinetobacter larvae]
MLSSVLGSSIGITIAADLPVQAHHYQVAAGNLGQVLSSFALQSGVALSFNPEMTKNYNSAGLHGYYSVEEGFVELLQQTPFKLSQRSNQTWTIIVDPNIKSASTITTTQALDSATADPAMTVLPTLVMKANQLGEITEGSASYTSGKIATATRLSLTPKETPQTITVISRQHIDDYQLNNIDDIMSHTPGITVSAYDSERTSYYSRGFAINNFQYDGIPSTTRNVGYAAGNTLSDSAIYDRVEVLKGATGLLTGVGSLGATINLVRKKPTADVEGAVNLSAGSWNNYRAMFDISGSLNDAQTVRGRLVTAGQDKESFMDRYERKSTVFYGILEVDLTENTLLTLGADYQDNKPKASTWSGSFPLFNEEGQRNPDPSYKFNNAANWSKWKQYTRTVFANLHHQFNDDWQVTMQYDHKINGYDAPLGTIQGYYPNLDGSAEIWPSKYKGRTVSDSLELYTTGKFNLFERQHDLVLGASAAYSKWKGDDWYSFDDYDSSLPSYQDWDGDIAEPNWGEPKSHTLDKTTQIGAYATTRLHLTDQLKALVGTRYINYKMDGLSGTVKENNRFIPFFGLVYDINDQVAAYASLSDIFMPYDIWYKTANNVILKPNQGKNYEVGFKLQPWGDKFNASAAYFEIHESNRAIEDIIYNGNPSNPAVDYAWLGSDAKTKGVEIEASGELLPNLQMQAGYTYKRIKDQNGEKLSTWEPEHQFNLSTQYQLTGILANLKIGSNIRWQDKGWQTVYNRKKDRLENITQNAFVVVDLMADYKINQQLSAAVNFNNIFDKRYFTNVGFYNSGVYGTPRHVLVSLKYTF